MHRSVTALGILSLAAAVLATPAARAQESSVGGAVTAGLLAGYRYFGLGYVYGFPVFPFRRPPWMAGHRFALRGAGAVHSDSTTEIQTE